MSRRDAVRVSRRLLRRYSYARMRRALRDEARCRAITHKRVTAMLRQRVIIMARRARCQIRATALR